VLVFQPKQGDFGCYGYSLPKFKRKKSKKKVDKPEKPGFNKQC
jgi:hypothetical protein